MVIGSCHYKDILDEIYRYRAEEKYVGLYQMMAPTLMVRDPELINNILIKDFSHFTDRGIPADIENAPLLNHLFSMEGEQWKIMRRNMSPAFTSRMLRNMYDQINECSDELIAHINLKLNKIDTIEIKRFIGNYSTDVIGTCVFGLKLNSIANENTPYRNAIKEIFNPSTKTIIIQLLTFLSPTIKKLLKLKDIPTHITDFFETSFRDTMKYRKENNILRNDLVQCLIDANTNLVINKIEPTVSFKETDIIANAFLMLIVGSETVATSLSFCLYELALNKSIQNQVREEIVKSEQKNINGSTFLMDLHYTEMVIAETLRKYPVSPIAMRITTATYQIPDDKLILYKGTRILIPIHSLHYDPKYFPEPEKFEPLRFTHEEKIKRPHCSYIPFGEGPRLCIGKRFAELEMKMALVKLLTKYEVEPCEKTEVPLIFDKRSIMYSPINGIWLKLKLL